MGIHNWLAKSCRFAQADVSAEAWKWFSQEEQFQDDRRMVRQLPYDEWYLDDKEKLIAATQAKDEAFLAQIAEKYKALDAQRRQKA